MRSKTVVILFFFSVMAFCDGTSKSLEAREKKNKYDYDHSNYDHSNYGHSHYGLWVHFAGIVLKKVFILKLAYAFVLWCVVHKAGYFLTWFISYLKEKKKKDHHEYHDHGPPHGHYEHDPYGPHRKSSYKMPKRRPTSYKTILGHHSSYKTIMDHSYYRTPYKKNASGTR